MSSPAGHIDGAMHITLQEVPLRCRELSDDRPAIVTCQVGQRSGLATGFLRERGIDARDLEGGLEHWHSQGLTLVVDDALPGRLVDGLFEALETDRR